MIIAPFECILRKLQFFAVDLKIPYQREQAVRLTLGKAAAYEALPPHQCGLFLSKVQYSNLQWISELISFLLTSAQIEYFQIEWSIFALNPIQKILKMMK
jgi:hypothetical protein